HFSAQCGRRLQGFTEAAYGPLRLYPWPGNLRELRNAIERAAILARGERVTPEDLPAELRVRSSEGPAATHTPQAGAPITLEQLEEAPIRRVLEHIPSLVEAAQTLGIDQATLYRKRKKLGLD